MSRIRILTRVSAVLTALFAVVALSVGPAAAQPWPPKLPDPATILPWLKPKPKETKPAPPPAQRGPNVSTPTGYVAVADDATKRMQVFKDGRLVREMPISMGKDSTPTPNGTYKILERFRDMYMDSSTYGVPIDAPNGYRTYVEYATRISWSGIFVHGAPWSLGQQGVSNVSHGCINVSVENARWFFENVPNGSPVVVKNTVGGRYQPGT